MAVNSVAYKAVPVLEIGEALEVGDVVAEEHRVGPADVVGHHLAADGLTANVPDLQGDLVVSC